MSDQPTHLENLDWAGLTVLRVEECVDKLRAAPVARLGFVDAGEPVILPVNIAWHDGSIIFRTAHGSKLGAAMMGYPVCVQVDAWDAMEHRGFSVLAKGTAEEVVDDESIAEFERLPVRPWSRPDLRTHWVRVRVNDLTGRAIVHGVHEQQGQPTTA